MEEILGQNNDAQSIPATSVSDNAPTEKMLRQSEVNDIVGHAKKEAAQKAVEQYKRSQTQNAPSEPSYQDNRSFDTPLSEDRVRRMAGEEAQRLRDQWVHEAQTQNETQNAQRIVKNFYDKMAAGKEKYDDFDKVTGDIELARFPNTVHMLAEMVDNPHDVLYELSKNRAKLAQLELAAREFPQEALYDLKRLADSIKGNQSVCNLKSPTAPLSQQRPSNLGTDAGSNALSMRDLKAKYRG